MALLWMDSFDHYATMTRKYDSASLSQGGVLAANGRNGTNSFHVSANVSGGCSVVKLLGGTQATLIAGFALRRNGDPGKNVVLFRFREGTTNHIDLRMNTSFQLFFTRNGTAVGSAGTTVLSQAVYYYIEVKVFSHDTTGTVEAHINGAAEISSTGLDTRNAGTPKLDTIVVGEDTQNTGSSWDIDDLYVLDTTGSAPTNTFLGDSRVYASLPSGAGTTTQFTPSTGSNYQNVDEATPDDDTTYNVDSTAGHKDTFAMADLPSSAATVYATQELTLARKDDAGTRTLRQVIRSGGTDYEGSDVAVPDGYNYARAIRETNPNTAAAWSGAEIDAMEAGYKVQA